MRAHAVICIQVKSLPVGHSQNRMISLFFLWESFLIKTQVCTSRSRLEDTTGLYIHTYTSIPSIFGWGTHSKLDYRNVLCPTRQKTLSSREEGAQVEAVSTCGTENTAGIRPSRTGCGQPCIRGFSFPNLLHQMVGWGGDWKHACSVDTTEFDCRYELDLYHVAKCVHIISYNHSSEFGPNGTPGDRAVDSDSTITLHLLPCCILMRVFTIKNIQPSRPFTAVLPAIHRVSSEGTLTPSWQIGPPQGCNEMLESWADWFS